VQECLAAALSRQPDKRVLRVHATAVVRTGLRLRGRTATAGGHALREHPGGLDGVDANLVGRCRLDDTVERVVRHEAVGFHARESPVRVGAFSAEQADVVFAGVLAHGVGEVQHGLGRVEVGQAADRHLQEPKGLVRTVAFLALILTGLDDRGVDVPARLQLAHDFFDTAVFLRRVDVPLVGVGFEPVERVLDEIPVVGERLDRLDRLARRDDHRPRPVTDDLVDDRARRIQCVLATGHRQVVLVEIEQVGRTRACRHRRRLGHDRRCRAVRLGGGFRQDGLLHAAGAIDDERLDEIAADDQLEILGGEVGDGLVRAAHRDVELGQSTPGLLDQVDIAGCFLRHGRDGRDQQQTGDEQSGGEGGVCEHAEVFL